MSAVWLLDDEYIIDHKPWAKRMISTVLVSVVVSLCKWHLAMRYPPGLAGAWCHVSTHVSTWLGISENGRIPGFVPTDG